MTARRYAHVRHPWAAVLDVGAPGPARQYARIITQALRYGLPATRRPAALWAFAGRRSVPHAPVAAALRRLPARRQPDLDALLAAVLAAWDDLAARSPRLPDRPPELALLALERASARTVFVMGDAPHPLLVLKLPRDGAGGADREAGALARAAGAAIAPRTLGRLGDARVEEGLPGAPLRVEPLPLRAAGRLTWPAVLADVGAGLARLAEVTAAHGDPAAALRPSVERALASGLLASAAQRALAAAWRDVQRLGTTVLCHQDTSPQNCLVADGRLTGLVDWEMADPAGPPLFDVLNTAHAYVDSGVGLVRWSQEIVAEAFERSWEAPGFWPQARAAAHDAARAAGVPETALGALEVVFFGSRVGNRLGRPGFYPTTAATAARILDVASR